MQGRPSFAESLVVNSPLSFDGSESYFTPGYSTYNNECPHPSAQSDVSFIGCF